VLGFLLDLIIFILVAGVILIAVDRLF